MTYVTIFLILVSFGWSLQLWLEYVRLKSKLIRCKYKENHKHKYKHCEQKNKQKVQNIKIRVNMNIRAIVYNSKIENK